MFNKLKNIYASIKTFILGIYCLALETFRIIEISIKLTALFIRRTVPFIRKGANSLETILERANEKYHQDVEWSAQKKSKIVKSQ